MKKLFSKIVILFLCSQFVNAQYIKLFDFPKGNDLSLPQNTKPVFDGTWLYDVTSGGGAYNYGTIYRVRPDGSDYAKLFDFTGDVTDGKTPLGSLLLKGDTLFGTLSQGGANSYGCIFSIKTDGTSFQQILSFTGLTGAAPGGTPQSGFVLLNDTLYGNTYAGGNSPISFNYSFGVIYKVKTDGTGYTVLKDLNSGSNIPSHPSTSLVLNGNLLYGLSKNGGSYGCLFKISTNGVYTLLHNFTYNDACGNLPTGSPLIANGKIYGTTSSSAGSPYTTSYYGCLFSANLDGTGMTKLSEFGSPNGQNPVGGLVADSKGNIYGQTSNSGTESIFKIATGTTNYTEILKFNNVFASNPQGELLILGDSALYGTTQGDGNTSKGGLFALNINSNHYRQVLIFKTPVSGANPYYGMLTASGDTLFGVTHDGGDYSLGCIYKILPDGTYIKIHDFDRVRGGKPLGSLILSGNVLYGTTTYGGKTTYGCAFKINTNGAGYDSICSFPEYFDTYGAPVITNDTLIIVNSMANKIYSVRTNGAGFKVLRTFSLTDYKGYYIRAIVKKDNTIYGTAFSGGSYGNGCLYKMQTDGSGFSNFYNFNTTTDRGRPVGTLTVWGDTIFGATQGSTGCVYRIKTNGTGLKVLQNFDGTTGNTPYEGVCLKDNKLYGLTSAGTGNTYWGTMYSINTDGTGFNKLVDFNSSNGNYVLGGLAAGKNALFGFTKAGGDDDLGVVFKYSLPKIDPEITWENPYNIIEGTALSPVQLNATANVSGSFTYTPPSGTVLPIGSSQQLSVLFTPDDAETYNTISKTVLINVLSSTVLKTNPVITWANPADIIAGIALSATQLNATADVPGSFTYTPTSGTVLPVGNSQSLSVVFTPNDANTYNTINKTVFINVISPTITKTNPVITWANPSNIVLGTTLSSVQLNATANIPGTFSYTPNTGTKLEVGNNQKLTALFTPTDTTMYNSISANVYINVVAPTGIKNITEDIVDIYPNPAYDMVSISSKKPFSTIDLVEMNGRVIKHIDAREQTYRAIDISDLKNGRYILIIKDIYNHTLTTKHLTKIK
jgi:hypothetical protein